MKSLFSKRHIAVVILFTFVSLSGCAYHKHMNNAKKNGVRLNEELESILKQDASSGVWALHSWAGSQALTDKYHRTSREF